MTSFTADEIALLARYVSDPNENIFVVSGLTGIIGAVYARYSRSPTGFRETFLREFLNNGNLDPRRADELIERVLVAYGDDSVGELEGTHLSIENISILATKEIEDRRIGGSPIEQSTRYIIYNTKDDNGRFRFFRDPKIMASEFGQRCEDTLNFVFQTYSELVSLLHDYFKKLKPIEDTQYAIRAGDEREYMLSDLSEERDLRAFRLTYKNDIKTKACDVTRVLLPAATLTNIGIFGNGRFFQGLLSHLYTLDAFEMNDIAARAHTALNTVMPRYVKRASRSYYLHSVDENMKDLSNSIFSSVTPDNDEDVVLLDNPKNDKEYMDFLLAVMLYKYSLCPMRQIRSVISKLPDERKIEIFNTYICNRENRRNRPGRALEFGYPLTFDLTLDYGDYRDLERHRILTQERQMLTPDIDFVISDEIDAVGFRGRVNEAVERSAELYNLLKKDFPYEAQYAVLLGFKIRWMVGMNPREAMHMLELRTGKQGHPRYRAMCQSMHNLISQRWPLIGESMSFVDHRSYYWSRAESEAGQRRREK